MRLLRSPLLHFLVLGIVLFAAQARLDARDAEAARYRIAIDGPRIDDLERDFVRRTGRAPDRRELAALIEAHVEEEILYREAVARGLLTRDGGVQTRLVQKMLFLEGETALEEAPDLLARAIDLRLYEDDIVVRRILVQKMRLLGSTLRDDQRAGRDEIEAAYRSQRESLRPPDRVDLVHVFLSRDRHAEALEDAAKAVLERLRDQIVPPDAGPGLGEPFPLGHTLRRRSRDDLERRFGAGFGDAVFAAPPRTWTGPVLSAYGAHLVWLADRAPGEPPPLERVADRLRLALEEDRRLANLDALLETLRARYHVSVPDDRTQTATDVSGGIAPPNQEPG